MCWCGVQIVTCFNNFFFLGQHFLSKRFHCVSIWLHFFFVCVWYRLLLRLFMMSETKAMRKIPRFQSKHVSRIRHLHCSTFEIWKVDLLPTFAELWATQILQNVSVSCRARFVRYRVCWKYTLLFCFCFSNRGPMNTCHVIGTMNTHSITRYNFFFLPSAYIFAPKNKQTNNNKNGI